MHTKIGTTGRGTTILSRDQLQLTNIVRLPTGRGMAARFQNVILVNIYAPSGAERREREKFFASELPYLLQGIPTSLVMGRLQQRPLKCRRHRTYKLQSDTTRVNTWLRPNRYVGNGTWTGHIHTLYKTWGVRNRQNIHITQLE